MYIYMYIYENERNRDFVFLAFKKKKERKGEKRKDESIRKRKEKTSLRGAPFRGIASCQIPHLKTPRIRINVCLSKTGQTEEIVSKDWTSRVSKEPSRIRRKEKSN